MIDRLERMNSPGDVVIRRVCRQVLSQAMKSESASQDHERKAEIRSPFLGSITDGWSEAMSIRMLDSPSN